MMFFTVLRRVNLVRKIRIVRLLIGVISASSLRTPQLSHEEEEKKKVRRERNKMAAAKCRNRRRELTDTLQTVSYKLI